METPEKTQFQFSILKGMNIFMQNVTFTICLTISSFFQSFNCPGIPTDISKLKLTVIYRVHI